MNNFGIKVNSDLIGFETYKSGISYPRNDILQNLIKSSSFLITGDKATGVSGGVNAPLTNTWTDLVGKVGKNLFDPATCEIGTIDSSTGNNGTATNRIRTKSDKRIKVNPSTTYIRSNSANYVILNFYFYDINGAFISALNATAITTPSNCEYMSIVFRRSDSANMANQDAFDSQIQLELGTVATAYEPYGKSNVLLQGFAGTVNDGWVSEIAPNGKTVIGLKADGVDSVGIMPNSPSISITGTGDFAILVVFKTPAILKDCVIISFGNGDGTDDLSFWQYAQTYLACRVGGNFIALTGSGALVANTWYKALFYRVGGRLKLKLQNAEPYNQANSTIIATAPLKRLFAKPTNVDGTTYTDFSNLTVFTLGIINGAITPFTEADLIKKWDAYCKSVYGL